MRRTGGRRPRGLRRLLHALVARTAARDQRRRPVSSSTWASTSLRRRDGEPAVDQRLAQCPLLHDLQLDQHGGVAVEVRDCEERLGIGGEHGLLLAEIVDAHRQNRPRGRRLVTEPFDVGLAERPLPRERLAADGPRAVAEPLANGHLRQGRRHVGDLLDAHHRPNGSPRHLTSRTDLRPGRPVRRARSPAAPGATPRPARASTTRRCRPPRRRTRRRDRRVRQGRRPRRR